MTDSMIPYSFIPGTKAKASEVNSNFIALATAIAGLQTSTTSDLAALSSEIEGKITQILQNKADKTELNVSTNVTETGTDLDNYSTPGTYIFSSACTPLNIPKGESGMLITMGADDTPLKQIWICDGENPEMFIRSYKDEEWQTWDSTLGVIKNANVGYIKFPNDFKIQWGWRGTSKNITYPIAHTVVAVPTFDKQGYTNTNGDTGFTWQGLTGFKMETVGMFGTLSWIVVGF